MMVIFTPIFRTLQSSMNSNAMVPPTLQTTKIMFRQLYVLFRWYTCQEAVLVIYFRSHVTSSYHNNSCQKMTWILIIKLFLLVLTSNTRIITFKYQRYIFPGLSCLGIHDSPELGSHNGKKYIFLYLC